MKYALRALEESVRISPDFADAYRELGSVYREIGDDDAALQACQQVVSLDPGDEVAQYNLGEIYLVKRMRKEAEAAFAKAVEIRPGFAEAHYQLGRIYVLNNDMESAFHEYGILVGLDRRLASKLFDEIYE